LHSYEIVKAAACGPGYGVISLATCFMGHRLLCYRVTVHVYT